MKDFIKTMLVSIVSNVIVAVISSYVILMGIQKHSVHPVHGNLKKVDYEYKSNCNPWDSC